MGDHGKKDCKKDLKKQATLYSLDPDWERQSRLLMALATKTD